MFATQLTFRCSWQTRQIELTALDSPPKTRTRLNILNWKRGRPYWRQCHLVPLTDEGPTLGAPTIVNNTFFQKHLCAPGTLLLVWKSSTNFLPSPKTRQLASRGRRYHPVFKETPLADEFSSQVTVAISPKRGYPRLVGRAL